MMRARCRWVYLCSSSCTSTPRFLKLSVCHRSRPLPGLGLALVLSACSTYQSFDAQPQTLANRIRAGDLVQPGDRVRVTLVDGAQVAFRVTQLDDVTIGGARVAVPIDEIVELESKDFDPVKTGVLVGGMTLGTLGLILAALSSMTFLAM